jgi:hypothetical protein
MKSNLICLCGSRLEYNDLYTKRNWCSKSTIYRRIKECPNNNDLLKMLAKLPKKPGLFKRVITYFEKYDILADENIITEEIIALIESMSENSAYTNERIKELISIIFDSEENHGSERTNS